MYPRQQCEYFAGTLVRIFGSLDYGTGNDRWTGVCHGVVQDLHTGEDVAVLHENGRELPTLVPVRAVREVRPAGR